MGALVFNKLAVIVRTDDGEGVPQMALPRVSWLQVWPGSGPTVWPPSRPAADSEVMDIASVFTGWLQLPDLPKFDRSLAVEHIQRN